MADAPPPPQRPVRQPIGSVPAVVGWLIAIISAVTAAQLLGPFALREALLSAGLVQINTGFEQPLGAAAPYVLHAFLHAGWMHLILNMVALLAFGTAAARALGDDGRGVIAFLVLFFVSVVAGALVQVALHNAVAPGEPLVLLGASSGVSGAIAGSVYVYRAYRPGRLPAPWSGRYLGGLLPWIVLNLIVGALGASTPMGGQVAWAAHIGGLIAGAVGFPFAYAWARMGSSGDGGRTLH